MSKTHTKETVTFDGFSGYYGSITAGYGGFDYIDVDYMNATYWENERTNWCDTGYQNAIQGTGEAFSFGTDVNAPTFSLIQSSNSKETFTLTSMVAASAWETKQPFEFISYVYKDRTLVEKASDTVHLSQTAKTIDFAKIAGSKPTDFQNIAAFAIVSGFGKYGNTCTYGPYGYTTGNELALDNLKITWNGKIPGGHGGKSVTKGLVPSSRHHAVTVAAQLGGDGHHAGAANAHPAAASGHHGDDGGYHSQLSSLPGMQSGGLTDQFHLPAVEHFGT